MADILHFKRKRKDKTIVGSFMRPSGVYVEGTPLDEYLKLQELEEKTLETEKHRSSEVSGLSRVATQKHLKARDKRHMPQYRSKIKHFTDNEIRKEYGLMAKPFRYNTENVIWAFRDKPDQKMTSTEVTKITGIILPNVSSRISQLVKTGLLQAVRDPLNPRKFQYWMPKEIAESGEVEELYKTHKVRIKEIQKTRKQLIKEGKIVPRKYKGKKEKKEKKPSTPTVEEKPKEAIKEKIPEFEKAPAPSETDEDLVAKTEEIKSMDEFVNDVAQKVINKLNPVLKAGSEATLNVNVAVDVRFGIIRE